MDQPIELRSSVNGNLVIRAYHGHFATNHSHINYYMDMSRMKHDHKMAKEAAITMAKPYIDTISVSRIAHPGDRFAVGMDLRVVVRGRDDRDRITLTHRELLGTWQENADLFSPGETVPGVVRSVEDYGIFVELMPNLAGLAEYRSGVRPGQQATVTVKSLSPQKMKVKLILIESYDDPRPPAPPRYFFTGEHLDRWDYSPPGAARQLTSVFSAES